MKNKSIPLVFTDAEKCKILKFLLDEHEEKIDGVENPAFNENHQLGIRVLRSMDDSARLDYLEKQARLSYTGLSINGHPNGTTEIMWRMQRFEPQPTLRQALDLARKEFPEGQSHPVPKGQRAVIGNDQMVRLQPEETPVPEMKWPGPAIDPAPSKSRSPKQKKPDYGDPVLNTVMELVKSQASHCAYNGESLHPATDLLESGHLDSLDHIELIMALEDEYAMEILDEDAEKIRTPLQIVEYVNKNRRDNDHK